MRVPGIVEIGMETNNWHGFWIRNLRDNTLTCTRKQKDKTESDSSLVTLQWPQRCACSMKAAPSKSTHLPPQAWVHGSNIRVYRRHSFH